ncbi:MAG TPA: hypothetical protein VJR58_06900, partial [Vineibacter sp.]|nr:hypothetical protein [Vineibacter sp.]
MTLWRALLVVALVLGLGGTAYAQLAIGTRSFAVDDLPGEPPIPLTVWYPAASSGITPDGEPAGSASPPPA